ncbi:RNA polymerase sigma factor SigF [Nocardioides dongxiaopingii]|uniref:RNA polymerase sigma factor SigF n=1 Tax=Nocardioides sp. S-1144 TaxID=2582905 RepID=UPI001163CC27|nr:RNA polymerase sigma factor SigF [Nocardioides sp. S-1144]QCW50374.2 RNA polymerase sigma factor SigF [Nocardioides sp. S-1144]
MDSSAPRDGSTSPPDPPRPAPDRPDPSVETEDVVQPTPAEARLTRVEATRRRSAELFVELRDDLGSEASRAQARDDLVHLHLPLVEHCARRFRNRGEPFEDLVQVGTIGLIKSVDRFDTERGVEFSTYATPTIIGEIKRYFRDKGWAIRVPRRLQELRMQISAASAELTQSLGRSPTPRELAETIGCTVEEIVEGIESSNAYSTLSLDASDDSDEGGSSMLDAIGVEDEGLEHVEIRESIKPLLEQLAPREKRILLLRFFKNMTQSQIAEEIGVSQMHVSRLLNRTLEQLRTSLEAPDPE